MEIAFAEVQRYLMIYSVLILPQRSIHDATAKIKREGRL